MTLNEKPPHPHVAALLRWEEHGALWRVAARTGTTVTVSMRTCDGGTEVDRITSDDPELVAFVDRRLLVDEQHGVDGCPGADGQPSAGGPLSPAPPRST